MERKPGNGGGAGEQPPVGLEKGGRSWAKVVQGDPRQPLWISHRITKEEVEKLRCYFTDVLEFPEEEITASRKEWENLAIFVWSLGRRVPLDWVAKEIREKCKLEYNPESFAMAKDHYLIRFREVADCDAALRGDHGLLPVNCWPWRAGCRTLFVWLRLPGLPIKQEKILGVAAKATGHG
ncbi:hypothetical protein COCNU_15G004940 [Cocos nucifera]|uniref:DUF4283 domain-containing protein n=1 Tax=Cocos nucifera TaxID=13894 RepID=A0A8K0IXI8_COCNU|nr:hypothetical protein COCNU_15G004940 [Cocos nucifera]